MNAVKYVPDDPAVRAKDRTVVLVFKTCANPMHVNPDTNRRKMSAPQADRAVAKQGWVRLSELKPAERALYRGVPARVRV